MVFNPESKFNKVEEFVKNTIQKILTMLSTLVCHSVDIFENIMLFFFSCVKSFCLLRFVVKKSLSMTTTNSMEFVLSCRILFISTVETYEICNKQHATLVYIKSTYLDVCFMTCEG